MDPAMAGDDERVDSGESGLMVIPRVHLRLKTPTEEDKRQVEQLRGMLQRSDFWSFAPHREWLTDQTLLRFLIARDFNLDKAMEMLSTALTWRALRQPYALRAGMEEMAHQGRTGKIYLAGFDRWKRPVVIFNNSVNNSNDPDAQMRYLAFNLETALRRTRGTGVCKFVIFMHMYDFSLFNSPPFKVTRETIQIVTTCYPETMGHCVIYLPPFVFSAFFDSVKRFIDPRSASKIIMISGDISEGSPNDRLLTDLIGPNWKEQTGAGMPRLEDNCSPGFDYPRYWAELLEVEKQLEARDAQMNGKARTQPPPTIPLSHGSASSANSRGPRRNSYTPSPVGAQAAAERGPSPGLGQGRSSSFSGLANGLVRPRGGIPPLPPHAHDTHHPHHHHKHGHRHQHKHHDSGAHHNGSHHHHHHHQEESSISRAQVAVVRGPLKSLPQAAWLLLGTAVSALAIQRPFSAIDTGRNTELSGEQRGEALVLGVLVLVATCILVSFPNPVLSINVLLAPRRYPPTGGVVTLRPIKGACTKALVTTAAGLAAQAKRA